VASRFYLGIFGQRDRQEADFGFSSTRSMRQLSPPVPFTSRPRPAPKKAMTICSGRTGERAKPISMTKSRARQKQIASGLLVQARVPIGRMRSIGSQWIYTMKRYRSLSKKMATVRSRQHDSLRNSRISRLIR